MLIGKQSLFDGARESPIYCLSSKYHFQSMPARATQWKSFSQFERFLIEVQLEEKIASNINQHFVELSSQRSTRSEVKSRVVCDIRFDIKPTAKQKCRQRFLMSKYFVVT